MRLRLLALLAAGLLGGCLAGCGGAGRGVSLTRTASGVLRAPAGLEGDEDDDDTLAGKLDTNKYDDDSGDFDNDLKKGPKRFYDSDDASVADYGHAASPAQARAVAAMVERYYHLLASDDGAAACSLLYPTVARTMTNDFSRFGPSYLRGAETCAPVLSRLGRHERTLPAEARQMVVVAVRVDGSRGLVLFGGPNMRASSITILREGSGWKIGVLIGTPLP